MDKISFFITDVDEKGVLDELIKNDFDVNIVKLIRQRRVSDFELKLKVYRDKIKTFWQVLLQDIEAIIKYGRKQPRFGGGGYDYEFGYQLGKFIATIIISGFTWDIIKLVIKKSYKALITKKQDYIAIVSNLRQPAVTRIKILIPNNLDENNLEYVLNQAEQIYNSFDPIRNLFFCIQIVIKYENGKGWQLIERGKKW